MRSDEPPVKAGRGQTRLNRFALALAAVAALAGVAAMAADAVEFDDAKPCPAAYTEPVGEEPEPGPPPPFICPEGLVGTPYSLQLVGHGGCEPYFSFNVLGGAMPPGLSLSSRGLVSGVPSQAGSWTFSVRMQDLDATRNGPEWCTTSSFADGAFSIAVRPGVVVTTDSAGPGTVGAPYQLALSAQTLPRAGQLSPLAGCSASESPLGLCPLTWSVAQGQLPAGLRLNSVTGVVLGTPTAAGSSSFVVRAALDDGRAGTKSLSIMVRLPLAIQAQKPFAVRGAPTLWEVGVPFRARLAASGGAGTYSWSVATGKLPTGLALAADGTVAGTPLAPGRFVAMIRLADDEGRTADHRAVFGVASRVAISTVELRPARVGLPYRVKLTATGGVRPRTWSIASGSLPRGVRLDRARGTIRGTPTSRGSSRVTIEATDALGAVSRRTFVIVVT